MRVLFINSDYGFGSTGRIVQYLKHELEKNNDESIALFGRENLLKTEENVFRIGNRFTVYWHVFRTRTDDLQGFSSRHATQKSIQIIQDFHPDIVHLHNLHGSYIDCQVLFKYLKNSDIQIVWTLHDCWSFTGHCSNYSFVHCEKWKKECYRCPQTRVYPKSFIDRSIRNFKRKKDVFCDCKNLHITTVSKWLKGEVEKSFLKKYPITVVPNGVDLDVFTPHNVNNLSVKFGLKNKKVLISVASVWNSRKGLDLLLSVANRLNDDYRWIVVGLKRNPKQLPNCIIPVTRTNSLKELSDLYSVADVFVNTSVEETFGLVTLEALACGKPVVTNMLTANPELIDESCGVVVKTYDVENYISAITSDCIWNINPNDCRFRAEGFSHRNMISGYTDLYRSLL